jgi:xylan 1,4-beta-xylosidase
MLKPIATTLIILLPTILHAQKTFCNPLNLPYNFQNPGPTRREAADPLVVVYQDKYWLFASKQIGYWWSDDLLNWHLIQPTGLPLQVYAPAVAVVDGKLYYTAGEDKGTFTTDDPITGHWSQVSQYKRGCADPDLFQDDDGKVYLFDGCSDKTKLRVTELDRHTFTPISDPVNAIGSATKDHGWEVPGDNNEDTAHAPWIEGSWVTKLDGHYFWQYAGPGTQFKTYADGVYVADKPTGPYTYLPYSPFSFKPTGFIAGAGHSATFADKKGELWHIATGTISVRHMFERRLMLFPAGYYPDNEQLAVNTYLGDYPALAPGTAKDHLQGNLAGWMLLSYQKEATASSTLNAPNAKTGPGSPSRAFDEDIRTWWSAQTGNPGEWLQVDLGKTCRINAIQVNFADQDADQQGPLHNDGYRYEIESSEDNKTWHKLIDKNDKDRDTPHDYTQLDKPAMARYIKIINGHSPANSRFSLYDLRIFGSALGKAPEEVTNIKVIRNEKDRRHATITWSPAAKADFYIVRYGLSKNRLFGNYQVYNATSLEIPSLNTQTNYIFTVDAVNGSGITKGATTY